MKRNRGPKQPHSQGTSRNQTSTEPIEVYCRVKPLQGFEEDSCLTIIPPNQIKISPSINNQRYGGPTKAMLYTFKRVFEESASQKCVFNSVALPFIENVLNGKNGLLFTYGVTGSGKTYTMTGTGQDGGILPRCLDIIFNSIGDYQARKYIFKPDRLNSFDIQSEEEALADKEQDLLAQIISTKCNRNKFDKKGSDPDIAGRIRDTTKLDNVDENNCYSVFITYVEIYNNTVYDLLDDVFEESSKAKPLQAKIVREDASHNMYVHAANEMEIYSTDEAFEIFYRAQKRKRVAQTLLNSESSRSHSVFTIRVVQAPLDENGEKVINDKNLMVISQLSLVDLAGSERTNRTKNTGQRLKEASNINNSLLTLRTCLELLRENQNGANKIIPYRESRLTHLFKNYFDGEGKVAMIVCVNQRVDDYDENLQVMKFAEMSQEVQITCPSAVKLNTGLTPGRKRAFREMVNYPNVEIVGAGDANRNGVATTTRNIINGVANDSGIFAELFTSAPDLRFVEPDDNEIIPGFCNYMDANLKRFKDLASEHQKKRFDFRDILMQSERHAFLATQEVNSWKSLYEKEKERTSAIEAKAASADSQAAKMKRKIDEYEIAIKKLKQEACEKDSLLAQNRVEKDKVKEHYSNKLTQAQDKLNKEMERKLRSQKSALEYEMRNKDEKLRAVKRLLSDEDVRARFDNVPGNRARLPIDSKSVESLISGFETPKSAPSVSRFPANTPASAIQSGAVICRSTARKMGGVPVSNRRHRRSRSAGDVWLEHKPKTPIPLNTLMQPTMTKRKSVNKLTDAKDVTEKSSKYCLMTHGQDSDGDLETRLYKGDIIPTSGGGAQVLFNDVEVLKQKSPISPSRKRPDEIRSDIEAACAVALEGHKRRK